MSNFEPKFKRFLQILFCVSLVAPLFVDRRLFFPYVTGSALFFRFFAVALLLGWLAFILFYPKYRPKLNFLNISVLVYILAMAEATFFGVSPSLSFWGDAERMMGLFGFLHFFVLFFAGQSIFREKKDLFFVLNFFAAVTLAMALYGIFQKLGWTSIKPGIGRIESLVGNAAILASYLIFGLFFCTYLAFKAQKPVWRRIYAAAGALQLLAIFLTGTRGAFLGLAAGFLLAVFFVFKNLKEKKVQRAILVSVGILAIIYGFLYVSQGQDWVRKSPFLYRITHISLQDATVQGRFLSWKWGLQGFWEKPVLGWGFNNYVAPFNKHFESSYYNFADEEYFDRAHNIIVEHLATTGAIGLLAYLLFLFSILYFLVRKWKEEKDIFFLAAFGGLFLAYFVQNLFLFDSLPSMLGLMVLLVFLANSRQAEDNLPQGAAKKTRSLRSGVVFVFALVLLAALSYYSNRFILEPYKSLKDNIAGQLLIRSDYKNGIEFLKRSVNRGTFLDSDLRTASANTIFNHFIMGGQSGSIKADLDFAIAQYKNNLRVIPGDAYYNYKLAEILNFRYSIDIEENFRDEANVYINQAIASSPKRASLYYIQSENLLFAGKFEEAIAAAQKAVDLNPQRGASWWQLTKAYYITQDFEKTKECFRKTIDLGHRISEENFDKFAPIFGVLDSPENQIEFFELIVKNGTQNYIYDSTLANLYYETKNYEEAILHARRSAELNPAVEDRVDKFIERIQKESQI